jgi:hypothetical protein
MVIYYVRGGEEYENQFYFFPLFKKCQRLSLLSTKDKTEIIYLGIYFAAIRMWKGVILNSSTDTTAA